MCCGHAWYKHPKNGISRFSSSSMVNLMLGCLLLRKSRKLEAVSLLSNREKVSSTYLNQIDGRNWLCVILKRAGWRMAPTISGQNCKFFMFLLSLNSQKRLGHKENNSKYRSLTWKPLRAMVEYWYIERGLFLNEECFMCFAQTLAVQ